MPWKNISKEKLREYNRKRYWANVEKFRAKSRATWKRLHERGLVDRKDRVKLRARWKVSAAIKAGRMVKPEACSRCGITGLRLEGHHEDYSKPLEVIWVCSKCHGEIERIKLAA